MGEPDRSVLSNIREFNTPGGPIAEQMLIERQMFMRRNQQNLADAGQHEHR
jgi:hypothetical protein